MDLGLPAGEVAALVAILLAGGALTGVLAGVFGIGGGAILVPILFELFGAAGADDAVRMHLSVATSLAIIVPTSVRSFLGHRARGTVDMAMLRSWAPGVLAGVIIGSLLIAVTNATALRAVYAVTIALMAARMAFLSDSWRLGDDLPGGPLKAIYAMGTGILSVLMGVGGGAMFSTIMMLYNRPILQAVSTASGLGIIISIPATIGFVWSGWGVAGLPAFSLGYINWLGVLLVIPASLLTAPLGVRLAHSLSRRHLEVAFAGFLFLVAARFFWSLT
ncbi:MAG: sulfite exporter TauE/SafE family protein [Alphaproteobacteria bacterium]